MDSRAVFLITFSAMQCVIILETWNWAFFIQIKQIEAFKKVSSLLHI